MPHDPPSAPMLQVEPVDEPSSSDSGASLCRSTAHRRPTEVSAGQRSQPGPSGTADLFDSETRWPSKRCPADTSARTKEVSSIEPSLPFSPARALSCLLASQQGAFPRRTNLHGAAGARLRVSRPAFP